MPILTLINAHHHARTITMVIRRPINVWHIVPAVTIKMQQVIVWLLVWRRSMLTTWLGNALALVRLVTGGIICFVKVSVLLVLMAIYLIGSATQLLIDLYQHLYTSQIMIHRSGLPNAHSAHSLLEIGLSDTASRTAMGHTSTILRPGNVRPTVKTHHTTQIPQPTDVWWSVQVATLLTASIENVRPYVRLDMRTRRRENVWRPVQLLIRVIMILEHQ